MGASLQQTVLSDWSFPFQKDSGWKAKINTLKTSTINGSLSKMSYAPLSDSQTRDVYWVSGPLDTHQSITVANRQRIALFNVNANRNHNLMVSTDIRDKTCYRHGELPQAVPLRLSLWWDDIKCEQNNLQSQGFKHNWTTKPTGSFSGV